MSIPQENDPSVPFTIQQLTDGPFDFPPPANGEHHVLYKSLFKLLNYLSIEWCGNDFPAHLWFSFGSSNIFSENESFDLTIGISNSELHINKRKLDEVFNECHELQPFLTYSIDAPSLVVTGSLSTFIKHFHKLWVTPKGVIVREQPLLTRGTQPSCVLYIFVNFSVAIKMEALKDLMYYYLVRLHIGCNENLLIDLKCNQGSRYHAHFPRTTKHFQLESLEKLKHKVNVKICRACESCRLQTTKPKEIEICGVKFDVKICVRQCFSAGLVKSKCDDWKFKGKLTILGPGSLPVLYQSDHEFNQQFNSLIQNWTCVLEGQVHLILIFECDVMKKVNIHQIMDILHDNCLAIFSKHQNSFKASINQVLGKPTNSGGITVDLVESSKRLARGISEIVELSEHSEFKEAVKSVLPYSSIESLQESILQKSRAFGIREMLSLDTSREEDRPTKHRKLSHESFQVGGFVFSKIG